MILHTALYWLKQNINHSLNSQKTSHSSPLQVSYRKAPIVRIWEKTVHVIMAPRCILFSQNLLILYKCNFDQDPIWRLSCMIKTSSEPEWFNPCSNPQLFNKSTYELEQLGIRGGGGGGGLHSQYTGHCCSQDYSAKIDVLRTPLLMLFVQYSIEIQWLMNIFCVGKGANC